MLKEYIQLMILDYLSSTPFIRKIVFIGGTNLRLAKGIDRFSEDLDFTLLKSITNNEIKNAFDTSFEFVREEANILLSTTEFCEHATGNINFYIA